MARSKARSGLPFHRVRFWLAWWAGGMLLWLLFTSTVNPAEALVGVGACAVAATAAEVVRTKTVIRFRPRLRWLRPASRIPWQIASDTWLVFAVLVRHALGTRRVRGTMVAVPFRHGVETDAGQSARRALATVGVSMTPNSIVIGLDPDADEMVVHQLVADPDAVTSLLGRP